VVEIFSRISGKTRDPFFEVLSRYTRVADDNRRQTFYDSSRTLQYNCNVQLETDAMSSMCLANDGDSAVLYLSHRYRSLPTYGALQM